MPSLPTLPVLLFGHTDSDEQRPAPAEHEPSASDGTNGQFSRADSPSALVARLRAAHLRIDRMAGQLPRGLVPRRDHLWAFTQLVACHEVMEEMLIFPVARGYPAGQGAVDARLAEHGALEHDLAALDELDPTAPVFDLQFADLVLDILDHSATEETDVFPLLELFLDDAEAAQLVEVWDASTVTTAAAAAELAENLMAEDGVPPAGRVVSLFDRVRQAVFETTRL